MSEEPPPKSFQLRFEGCDPHLLDVDLLSVCVASLLEPLDTVDGLVIAVAGDFRAAVRARSADPAHADQYDPHRTTGLAVAKTMPKPDGTYEVVVNAGLLASEMPQMDPKRIFAHEGYHVLLWQRGDRSPETRPSADIPRRDFLGLAGLMLEEFRVERALNERAWWPGAGYRDSTPEILTAFTACCRAGLTPAYPGEPIDRCFDSVMASFVQMTTHFAYLAAEHVVSQGIHPLPAAPGWPRFVGDFWPRILHVLGAASSAATTMDEASRERTIHELADILYDWLNHIGFAYFQTPGGPYFKVLRRDF